MAWSGTPRTEGTTKKPAELCQQDSQRLCMDGSCIPRMELCPEEEMLNQDTILIMVGVGMGVVLFLVMLYCLQQRRSANTNQQGVDLEETDHPELLMPPPAYDDAVNVNLYPLRHRCSETGKYLQLKSPSLHLLTMMQLCTYWLRAKKTSSSARKLLLLLRCYVVPCLSRTLAFPEDDQ